MANTAAAKAPKSAKTAKADPIPKGTHTVTPHLICAGAVEAIAFYKKALARPRTCACRVRTES